MLQDEKKTSLLQHNLILEDRNRLSVSGVNDVDSFDEQTIIALTDLGELTIKGEKLHITRLSLEIGELTVEGNIVALAYAETQPKNTGFFSKVFR